jgi:methyltransferase (TIGR00027 family)
MIEGQPSRTALSAAAARAAHQTLEHGAIHTDKLALPILGTDGAAMLEEARTDPRRRPMRIFIACRSRFAEDAITTAVAHGLAQLVILGAGLDTFAYRHTHGDTLKIIEVDHPSTQAWKRERLRQANIAIPPSLTYAPIDFERETLRHALAQAGFDPARRSFFMWLGVVPYLTEAAIFATLSTIAGLPGGAEVVFDYSEPPAQLAPETRQMHEAYAARVAAMGETWITHFEPDDLRARLTAARFTTIEDLGIPDLARRYFPGHAPASGRHGAHVVRAAA